MKVNGRVASVNVVTEMFIREGQDPIVFKATAITGGDDFTKYVVVPTPPSIRRVGEDIDTLDFTDEKYQKAMRKYGELQWLFLIIKSLEATPGLVWETIKIEDPTTWSNLDEELFDFGLSNAEKNRLIQAVRRANSLDENFIEEAKKRFIRSQQALQITDTSSPADAPLNTKSGEPVKS